MTPALAALLQLPPIQHDGAPNDITMSYGIQSGVTRSQAPVPSALDVDRIRSTLDLMKGNANDTVRQLQANMDIVGEFLKSQNALPLRAMPGDGPPMPTKLKLTLGGNQLDRLKNSTPNSARSSFGLVLSRKDQTTRLLTC